MGRPYAFGGRRTERGERGKGMGKGVECISGVLKPHTLLICLTALPNEYSQGDKKWIMHVLHSMVLFINQWHL